MDSGTIQPFYHIYDVILMVLLDPCTREVLEVRSMGLRLFILRARYLVSFISLCYKTNVYIYIYIYIYIKVGWKVVGIRKL